MDAESIESQIQRNLERRTTVSGGPNVRRKIPEPNMLSARVVSEQMVVARPKLGIGYKDTVVGGSGLDIERREIVTQILLDLMFGSSSANHDRLYAEGLVDDTFGASYSAEEDFGYSIIGGDTDDPERLAERVQEIIESTRRSGVPQEDFARTKNKYLGKFVRLFNSLEGSATAFMACHFRGFYPFDAVRLIDSIKIEDVGARLQEHLQEPMRSLSIIHPKTGTE
jgi:predicted Zn-dependent peptidase